MLSLGVTRFGINTCVALDLLKKCPGRRRVDVDIHRKEPAKVELQRLGASPAPFEARIGHLLEYVTNLGLEFLRCGTNHDLVDIHVDRLLHCISHRAGDRISRNLIGTIEFAHHLLRLRIGATSL